MCVRLPYFDGIWCMCDWDIHEKQCSKRLRCLLTLFDEEEIWSHTVVWVVQIACDAMQLKGKSIVVSKGMFFQYPFILWLTEKCRDKRTPFFV